MSTTIYCEGALYGPDGKEIIHPRYERISIPVDYNEGFHDIIGWGDLTGADISFFGLMIGEKLLSKIPDPDITFNQLGHQVVSLELHIPGKGPLAPPPFSFEVPGGIKRGLDN
jgi:hypothetical protein